MTFDLVRWLCDRHGLAGDLSVEDAVEGAFALHVAVEGHLGRATAPARETEEDDGVGG